MAFVVLHGLGSDHRQALSLLAPALPGNATLIAPDVRAHGASPLIGEPADFTLDALSTEIAASLPPEPLTLLGISMGAALALRLALRPDLEIERLVFIRPAFTDIPLPANLEAFPVMGRLLQQQGARDAERAFRETEHYERIAAVSRLGAEGAIEQFRKPDAAARAIRLTEIPRGTAFTTEAELMAVTAPATVIAAPRDPVHPRSIAEQWAGALPHASLHIVPARDDDIHAHVSATRMIVSAALD